MSGKFTKPCIDTFYEESDEKREIESPPKNKFSVGDIIKCVNDTDEWASIARLKIGEKYTALSSNSLRVKVKCSGSGNIWISNNCFELNDIIATPIDFAIGDKVKLIEEDYLSKKNNLTLGDVYTVSYNFTNSITIKESEINNYSVEKSQFELV